MRKTRSVRHGYRVSPIRGARFRRVTAGLTAWCFFMHVTLLPVVAQRVVVDPDAAASHQATLDTAPNGVPIQNIAAPNASGLSHNKFQEFNVGTEGLVINNRQAHGQSTLAGYILGNPNLQGGSEARLILNEVTGSTRSSLEGHTEIFGHPAEYILANPYGITCNGCGFLNIPRATFTTGAPTLDAATGLLTGFSVNGGDVMIGEHGVNGLELDYFDIVSRAIHVNGVIHGQDVGLFAGRNDFDYAARTVTARAADGSSKPRFGIDSSLLGGMYANRITLVGTEAGVGVRAPARMSAGTAGMVLTANGNLMVRHATSEGRITAHAQRNSLAIDGNVRADTALELMARDEIRLSQTAAAVAGGDLTASSKRLILGRDAILAAGLDHDGNLLASGTVNVTATDELTSSREALLVGGHRIKVTAGAVSNSGTISAGGQTTVTAATSVTNRGAITAQDDLAVTAGATLTNEAAATISSGHTLTLAVHDLVNRGTLAAQTGLDTTTTGAMENAGTVHSGKAATFTIAETFHNRNGATVLTKENLTLSASTIENAGEMIVEGNAAVTARTGAVSNSGKLSAGGRTTVTGATSVTNRGAITAQDDLAVTARTSAMSNSGKLSAGGRTTVTAATSVTNRGAITAQDDLEVTARTSAVSNSGTISAGGQTTVTGATSVTNHGAITAQDDLAVTARTSAVSNSGKLSAGGQTTVTGATSVTNHGAITARHALAVRAGATLSNRANATISSGHTLNLAARALVNRGTLAAQTNLNTAVTEDIDNAALMYAGRDAALKLNGTLTNREGADILAERNLTIAGRTNARAHAVHNSSGNMEAIAGNLVIKADTVTNEMRELTIEATETSSTETEGELDNSSYSSMTETTINISEEGIVSESAPARLLAGGDLTIEAETLTNSHSQIAANGDVTLTATTVVNEGRDLIKTTETLVVLTERRKRCALRIIFCFRYEHYTVVTEDPPIIETETVGAVYGTIEAGGTLTGVVTGYLENDAIREGAGQSGLSSGDRASGAPGDPASPNAPGDPGAAAPRFSPPQTSLRKDIDQLIARHGLFTITPNPVSPYLIETRPGFVDPGRFFGSNYFLAHVQINAPEASVKRLGDAFVETRLIRAQVFRQTGRRLLRGFGSDLAQIKGLYDQALAMARTLDLTPGIRLTAAQAAQLTRDIIWLEPMTVQGQRVLVPRLYLARVTREKTDLASGRLLGDTVALDTGLLRNTGAIEGRRSVALHAKQAVVNEGGVIASDGDVAVTSVGAVANLSGLITGETVTVEGQTVLNDTQVLRDSRGDPGSSDFAYRDRLQQRARIIAKERLTVRAEDDLRSTGGTFEAGGDVTLDAGGALELKARAAEQRLHLKKRGLTVNRLAVRQEQSRVAAGGDVQLRAGKDVDLSGTGVTGGGDVTVAAGGAVTIRGAQEREESEFDLSISSGGLFGTKTKIEDRRTQTEVARSELSAGGDLTITAGTGDLTLDAATLTSGGKTALTAAEGQVALLTETEVDFAQRKESSDSLLWVSQEDKGHHDETTVHVEIQAEGGLTVTTQDGVVVEYRDAGTLEESVAQLAVTPGLGWMGELQGRDDVDWVAIQEAHQAWHHKQAGLSGAASALIAIAVAVATSGMGAQFALAQMGTTTAAATTTQMAVAMAVDAGFTALVTQASTSLINNQGNLGAVFQELGSVDTLRSLATTLAAAGLTYGALDQLGLVGTETDLLGKLERGVVRATTRAGVQTALQGGNLGDNLQTAGIAALGAETAGVIGQAYHDGDLDTATRLIAQAAVGCAQGAASGHCASGAGGAVVGELAGDLYLHMQDAIRDPKQHKLDIAQLKQDGVNVARLVGGLTALVAGGDVPTAVQTAGTAAEQNAYRLVTTVLRATHKLGKIYRSTGKLTVQNLKDTGVAELAGMVDDLHTLFSSETSDVDKAGALFGLMLGLDFKDIKAAYHFAAKVTKSAKGGTLARQGGKTPGPGNIPSRPPVTNPSPSQLAGAEKHGVDPRWIKPDGKLEYPANNGFAKLPIRKNLKPGTKIDRYGGTKGEFLSPQGTPFEQRSLPAGHQATKEYHQYEVVKDLPVQAGKSAPWFGQPGGGTQFRLADGWTVEELIRDGFIKEIGP